MKILINKKFLYSWSIIMFSVSIVAFILDYFALVDVCPYCRTERICIIALSIFILFDSKIISLLITIPLILLGLDVAQAQIFLHIKEGTFPNGSFTILAGLAMYTFLISTYIVVYRLYKKS